MDKRLDATQKDKRRCNKYGGDTLFLFSVLLNGCLHSLLVAKVLEKNTAARFSRIQKQAAPGMDLPDLMMGQIESLASRQAKSTAIGHQNTRVLDGDKGACRIGHHPDANQIGRQQKHQRRRKDPPDNKRNRGDQKKGKQHRQNAKFSNGFQDFTGFQLLLELIQLRLLLFAHKANHPIREFWLNITPSQRNVKLRLPKTPL